MAKFQFSLKDCAAEVTFRAISPACHPRCQHQCREFKNRGSQAIWDNLNFPFVSHQLLMTIAVVKLVAGNSLKSPVNLPSLLCVAPEHWK